MKKYWQIYKMALFENLNAKNSFTLGVFIYISILLIFINLWKHIYSQTDVMKGYSYNQITWYTVLGECIWLSFGSKVFYSEISKDVKSGDIAYKLIRPYNYIFFFLAKGWGELTLRFFVYFPIGIIIGLLSISPLNNFSIFTSFFILISLFLGMFINSLIRSLIGLFSLWLEDSNSVQRIYNKLLIILGVLFPIDFLPETVKQIIKYTPIYVIVYGPVRLVINFSWNLFKATVLAQLTYISFLLILINFTYMMGEKKISVNGN